MEFSIDVQSAMHKLVEKQQLNHVHYTIQILRYALSLGPELVEIQTTGPQFCIRHNGSSLPHGTIEDIGNALNPEDEKRQFDSLRILENKGFLHFLFPFRQFEKVTLRSGKEFIQKDGPQVSIANEKPLQKGFEMQIARPSKLAEEEHREICFFCKRPNAQLMLNKHELPKLEPLGSFEVSLKGSWSDESGEAHFGLVPNLALGEIYYLKEGVLFGSRTLDESRVLPIVMEWNSHISRHEPNFEESVEAGNQALKQAREMIETALVHQFDGLAKTDRNQIVKRLLAMDPQKWPLSFAKLPIFRSSLPSVCYHLDDLKAMQQDWGWVPYHWQIPEKSHWPILILGSQELAFLRRTQLQLVQYHPLMKELGAHLGGWTRL